MIKHVLSMCLAHTMHDQSTCLAQQWHTNQGLIQNKIDGRTE